MAIARRSPLSSRRKDASPTIRPTTKRGRQLATLNGKRIPRAAYPRGVELDYYRLLKRAVKSFFGRLDQAIAPKLERRAARHDSDESEDDELTTVIFGQTTHWVKAADGLRAHVQHMATRTEVHNKTQCLRQLDGLVSVDVFKAEPWLHTQLAGWTRENVALIKDIGTMAAERVGRVVTEGVNKGHSTKAVRQAIQQEMGICERRAMLIAVDQIGKLNAKLTELRQRAAGVTHYRWRGILDQRERAAHVAREGRLFAWDEPPPDGHPGEPVRCRCSAEPALDKYSDQFEDPFAETDDEAIAREAKAAALKR